jgi:3-oxoacyl-[acyl-carrier-protein] synthase II
MRVESNFMSNRSVWITGVGAATPLGHDFRTIGDHLLAGHSGATLVIDNHPAHAQQLPTCLTPEPPTPPGWDDATFRGLARSDQFALWSAVVALEDAGWSAGAPRPRMGLALGSGGELLCRWETDWNAGGSEMIEGREHAPTLVWSLGERLGIDGPTSTIAAACASGNYAIAQARRWIELGLVDVCLAGGVEAISPMCRANFNNLRALSRRTIDVQRASRPFDKDRDGFVTGEGAAMFVLEAADHARRRGARAYAEVAGFGASSDAFHMIIPSSNPAPAASAISSALVDAGVEPQEVDYINAHATSTPVGDPGETRALHAVFGSYVKSVPVSSTKSMTGHLLSAAAAMEALACLVALERQAIPPTINLDEPDPDCDLCHVPHQAIERPVTIVLSNSFGFGGSNTSLVLRKAA